MRNNWSRYNDELIKKRRDTHKLPELSIKTRDRADDPYTQSGWDGMRLKGGDAKSFMIGSGLIGYKLVFGQGSLINFLETS